MADRVARKREFLTMLCTLIAVSAAASDSSPAVYGPLQAFAPWDMHQAVNAYRSSNGLPGPAYWQNRVDYAIHATLDETGPSLSGDEPSRRGMPALGKRNSVIRELSRGTTQTDYSEKQTCY